MIRLMSFGDDPSQCHSSLDEGRDNRKARSNDFLKAQGRKVGLTNFTGLVSKTKQTIWGPHLIQALEDAHEDYVALVKRSLGCDKSSQAMLQRVGLVA